MYEKMKMGSVLIRCCASGELNGQGLSAGQSSECSPWARAMEERTRDATLDSLTALCTLGASEGIKAGRAR